MGWLRYMFLGDFGQQLDLEDQKEAMSAQRTQIEDLRDELAKARRQGAEADTAQLQAEVDELRLYVAALTRVLVSRDIVSKEELQRIAYEIDQSDGDADNRFKGQIA
jgi:predicted phage tail protein